MSDRESIAQELYKEDFARKTATREAYFARGFDVARQRIAFYDRLILLAGGTLTLSFTAATTFRSKLPLICGAYLTTEAILFAVSIVFALAFSWLTLSHLVHSNRSVTIDSTLSNRQFSKFLATSFLFSLKLEESTAEDAAAQAKSTKWAKGTHMAAAISAVISVIAFVAAYVFFFLFVHANLFRNP